MLRLEDIRVQLGEFRLAADLTVPKGSICAVIGPSGSGKSTLLGVIAGFIAPEAGRVVWEGAELTGLAPGARPVAVIFQDQNLFPHLTVAENVGLGLRPALNLSADERVRVGSALGRVGLEDYGARRPAQLSGGQQSRVALARMLLMARPVVLLDEPFSALGPALRTEMLDLVGDLAGEIGATVLMISHDPEDARRIADRVIVVSDGRAAPPVGTAELFANPPEALSSYLG